MSTPHSRDQRTARTVMWRRVPPAQGHSIAHLAPVSSGWQARAQEVVVDGTTVLGCTYCVDLDREWFTRRVEITILDPGGARGLTLKLDADGRWHRDDGPVPDLDGCRDVDVAAAPLTNTFPLRRHASLDPGREVTLAMAWVAVPDLTVTRVLQTYTRVTRTGPGPAGAWLYSDPIHGEFRLDVDPDGMVIDYEGFAERLAPPATSITPGKPGPAEDTRSC